MTFLPDSIKGEDYSLDKDESLNSMMAAAAEAIDIPKEIMESPHLKDLAESTATLFRGSLNLDTTNAVTESVLEYLVSKIFPYSESFGEKLKGDYETPVTPPAIMATERFEDYEFQPLSAMEDQSKADLPITYADTVKDNAFIGDTPLDVIIEGIESQFDNYIGTEDRNNYVDIFYDQLHASYEAANDSETFKEDIIEVLNNIHQKFTDKMVELFNIRLTLTIADVESESTDPDDIEFIIRRLYEFFILDARNNFKVAIARDVIMRMGKPIEDHRQYIKMIRNMILDYSPLITTFGPMEFLKYRGDQEIIQFFENGKVVGNFLRKYSPKLYQNEDYEVDLINYITMVQQLRKDIKTPEEVNNNGGQQ